MADGAGTEGAPVPPRTLADHLDGAASLEEWSLGLREFLDAAQAVRRCGGPVAESVSAALRELVAGEPARHAGRFAGGEIADAFAGALASWLCTRHAGCGPPAWSLEDVRTLEQPWFALEGSPSIRARLLVETPAAFRSRNLFIDEVSLGRV